jgi:RNase P subunit RPR2
VLSCVPRLRTPPPCSRGLRCYHVSHISGPCLLAQLVGEALMLSRVLHLRGSWALRIKICLGATTCIKARVFLRHACALPRRLEDVQAGRVIMTCRSCGHALQYRTTVLRRATDRSWVWLAEAMTRQDWATLQTTHHTT